MKKLKKDKEVMDFLKMHKIQLTVLSWKEDKLHPSVIEFFTNNFTRNLSRTCQQRCKQHAIRA
jgi:GTP-binding protein EngB required for normal cell division